MFIFLFGGFDITYVAKEVCAGGLIFGAFFMATDYVTSPLSKTGQVVYGLFLGILTGIFRLWGASPEGVSYAIIDVYKRQLLLRAIMTARSGWDLQGRFWKRAGSAVSYTHLRCGSCGAGESFEAGH